jgi:hypothetical protein
VAKKVAHAVEENLPTVVAIGATIVAGHIIAPALGLSGAAAGAFGGFVGGFVGSGGDIEQAIIGGITGAAFGAIGGSPMGDPARVLAHAAVGVFLPRQVAAAAVQVPFPPGSRNSPLST